MSNSKLFSAKIYIIYTNHRPYTTIATCALSRSYSRRGLMNDSWFVCRKCTS